MDDIIRWSILGTGKVASRFAEALQRLPEAELLAVGSRSQASADVFADRFGAARRYGSYEEAAADADVDVVYVATPHVLHRENALLALRAGKALLCEKPFAVNAAEAEEVIGAARERGLFAMEAMWTRFIPLVARVRDLLADGVIGEPRMLAADFGFRAEVGPEHRLLDRRLGGGALLDVGIYPVSLASMVFGAPSRLATLAHLGETGVDETAAVVLDYGGGRMASLYTSITVDTPVEAVIMGTRGRIRLHRRMHHPERLTLTRDGRGDVDLQMPVEGNGLHYQAEEVMRCLRAGRTESAVMPLDETLSVLRTLDALRAEWGLAYPGEAASRPPVSSEP